MKEQLIEALNESGLIYIEAITPTKHEISTEASVDVLSHNDITEVNYDVKIQQYHDRYEVEGDINLILPKIRESILDTMKDTLKRIEYYEYASKEESKFEVSFDYEGEQYLVVKNTEANKEFKIPVDLLHNGEIAEYNIINRAEEIGELERMIGEAHGGAFNEACNESEIQMMRDDLDTLMDSSEEYVLANYGTNGFITKASDIKEFNEACQELVDSYLKYMSLNESKLSDTPTDNESSSAVQRQG